MLSTITLGVPGKNMSVVKTTVQFLKRIKAAGVVAYPRIQALWMQRWVGHSLRLA